MRDDLLEADGATLRIGHRRFAMPYPIAEVFAVGDLIVLLYEPDSVTGKVGQFPNLVALGAASGEPLWQAQLPTTETGDCYYRVTSRDPLVVLSVKSYECTIDHATGRIVGKEFFK